MRLVVVFVPLVFGWRGVFGRLLVGEFGLHIHFDEAGFALV
jgi:hypothetical protein